MVRDNTNKTRSNSTWKEIFIIYKGDKGFMPHIPRNSSYRIPTNLKKSNNRKMDNTHFKGEEMQNEKGTDLPCCWGNANKNRNKIPFSTTH